VSSMKDLSGKTLAVVRGTPQDIELSRSAPPDVKIVRYDDNNILATAYVTGQVQLIAAGSNIPALIGEKGPEGQAQLKIPFKSLPIGIGILKGDTKTKERIDAILEARRKSGELDALSVQWFGQKIPSFD